MDFEDAFHHVQSSVDHREDVSLSDLSQTILCGAGDGRGRVGIVDASDDHSLADRFTSKTRFRERVRPCFHPINTVRINKYPERAPFARVLIQNPSQGLRGGS